MTTTTVAWRPDIPLLQEIKNAKLQTLLRGKYFDEGATRQAVIFDLDLKYFEGLADAGMAEAGQIYEALERYGSIVLEDTA